MMNYWEPYEEIRKKKKEEGKGHYTHNMIHKITSVLKKNTYGNCLTIKKMSIIFHQSGILTQLVSVTKLKTLMGIDIYIIVTFSKTYCLSCIHSCAYGGNYWVKIYIIEFFIFLSRCWFERFFGITYQIKRMHFFNQ